MIDLQMLLMFCLLYLLSSQDIKVSCKLIKPWEINIMTPLLGRGELRYLELRYFVTDPLPDPEATIK